MTSEPSCPAQGNVIPFLMDLSTGTYLSFLIIYITMYLMLRKKWLLTILLPFYLTDLFSRLLVIFLKTHYHNPQTLKSLVHRTVRKTNPTPMIIRTLPLIYLPFKDSFLLCDTVPVSIQTQERNLKSHRCIAKSLLIRKDILMNQDPPKLWTE